MPNPIPCPNCGGRWPKGTHYRCPTCGVSRYKADPDYFAMVTAHNKGQELIAKCYPEEFSRLKADAARRGVPANQRWKHSASKLAQSHPDTYQRLLEQGGGP